MPKFKIESATISLKDALGARGVKDAFDAGKADLSGMTKEHVFISDVVHKAFISVDEKGTEAAAATAVISTGSSASADHPIPKVLTVDRPFVFAIRDNATGAVLFLGRVIKP